jgi:hypothetical protein
MDIPRGRQSQASGYAHFVSIMSCSIAGELKLSSGDLAA